MIFVWHTFAGEKVSLSITLLPWNYPYTNSQNAKQSEAAGQQEISP
jgi:hypothetical protein